MLTDFSHVADDVTSAAVIGPSRARFEGRDQTCTEVEAHYRVVKELMVPPGMILKLGRVTRRMCIDRTRNLILRDRFEADTDAGPDRYHIVQTVTYDRIDRNPPLSAALFDFQPPRNARLHQDPAPPPVAPPPSLPPGPRARVTTMPTPIERQEPEVHAGGVGRGHTGERRPAGGRRRERCDRRNPRAPAARIRSRREGD